MVILCHRGLCLVVFTVSVCKCLPFSRYWRRVIPVLLFIMNKMSLLKPILALSHNRGRLSSGGEHWSRRATAVSLCFSPVE